MLIRCNETSLLINEFLCEFQDLLVEKCFIGMVRKPGNFDAVNQPRSRIQQSFRSTFENIVHSSNLPQFACRSFLHYPHTVSGTGAVSNQSRKYGVLQYNNLSRKPLV